MAVYTRVSETDLIGFLRTYDIGEAVSCTGIAEGVENSNFLLVTTSGTFILTLFEKRVKSAELPFFVAVMEHLALNGFPAPIPVRDHAGDAIRRLQNRPAMIVTFIEGMPVTSPTPDHCARFGETLAHMHLLLQSTGHHRANALSLGDWARLLRDGQADKAISLGLADGIRSDMTWLTEQWPHTLPSGIIHADLFPDNVFFIGTEVSGVIDFYFSCTDMLAYDFALCLNAWCFEPTGRYDPRKAKALLNGYQSVRTLNADEYAALPILARGAAMRFFLTRLADLQPQDGVLITLKDPAEYAHILRFHRSISDSDSYFC